MYCDLVYEMADYSSSLNGIEITQHDSGDKSDKMTGNTWTDCDNFF